MAKDFEISAIFRVIDKASKPLVSIENKTRRFTMRMESGMRRVNQATARLGKVLSTGLKRGFQIATGAVVAFGAAARKVIMTGADFEQTMVSAASKFPGKIRKGTEEYQKLEDTARRIGKTTEFMAKDASQGLDNLALAGFGVEQAMSALPGVIDLATAAGLDLNTASMIATESLGALGLRTEDAAQLGANLARVNDVLLKTSVSSATGVQDLYEALGKVGPVAVASGSDVETLSAMIGTLANAKIKGEEAGTALRNIFLRLQAPTTSAAQKIRKYAGSITDSKGKMLDAIEIFRRLQKTLSKVDPAERTKIMADIFGARAVGPAMTMIQAGADSIEKLRDSFKNAAGTSGEMAATMRDTTSGAIKSVESAVEGVTISLFKLKDDAIKGVINRMAEWIRTNEELITSKIGGYLEYIINNFDKIVMWLKRLGIAATVIFGIITTVKALTAALTLLNLVMAANPVVLALLAIGAVVAVVAGLIMYYWDDVQKFMFGVFDAISTVSTRFWEGIKYIALWVAELVQEAWIGIKPFFSALWDVIKAIFSAAVDFIMSGPIGYLVDGVKLIVNNWGTITEFFRSVWSGVVEVFDWAWGLIDTYIGWISKGIDKVVGFVKDLFGGSDKLTVEAKIPPVDVKIPPIEAKVANESKKSEPQVIGQGDIISKSIEERMTIQRTEVTLKDETGKAKVTKGKVGGAFNMQPTGAF